MTLEQRYYKWLLKKCLNGKLKNYNFLLHRLWCKEYYWINPMDKNRAVDGMYLRYVFNENNYEALEYLLGGCRLLEMLIAFAYRSSSGISFEKTQWGPIELFWIMIDNLGFKEFNDDYIAKSGDPIEEIDYILTGFLENKNITLYPNKVKKDKSELFDQFNNWVIENEFF